LLKNGGQVFRRAVSGPGPLLELRSFPSPSLVNPNRGGMDFLFGPLKLKKTSKIPEKVKVLAPFPSEQLKNEQFV